MSGAGSFDRQNRTIFIGKIATAGEKMMDEKVERHFREWGEIEHSQFPTSFMSYWPTR